jgi:hypothetical protein
LGRISTEEGGSLFPIPRAGASAAVEDFRHPRRMTRGSRPLSLRPAIGGRVERHNNFDLLRLIAAVSVIFSHAFLLAENSQDHDPLMMLTGGQTVLGVVGVFVSFTISGYLVTQSFDTTGSPLVFLAKRALRVFPGSSCAFWCVSSSSGPWSPGCPSPNI